jgi:hypothetical protein
MGSHRCDFRKIKLHAGAKRPRDASIIFNPPPCLTWADESDPLSNTRHSTHVPDRVGNEFGKDHSQHPTTLGRHLERMIDGVRHRRCLQVQSRRWLRPKGRGPWTKVQPTPNLSPNLSDARVIERSRGDVSVWAPAGERVAGVRIGGEGHYQPIHSPREIASIDEA